MAPTIRISQETWARMKKYAVPLEDTPDAVIQRLLDTADREERTTLGAVRPPELLAYPRRKSKRLQRGLKLHETHYIAPILSTLYELGGQVLFSEVMDQVKRRIAHQLTAADNELLDSGEFRWRKTAAWILSLLGQNGWVSNPQRGVWELTTKGRNAVETGEFPETLKRMSM